MMEWQNKDTEPECQRELYFHTLCVSFSKHYEMCDSELEVI